jgi:dTDP-4-dehydrorhamnose 3,5-epimerase
MNDKSQGEIMPEVKDQIFVQDYSKKPVIDGVKIIDVKQFTGEDGTFEDLIRLNDQGYLEAFPDFQLKQVNRSKILPKSIKAWHIHLQQEDIWYISPEDHMILGLWDVRKNSPTKDIKMRVIMGVHKSKLVYIPRGVAHGVINIASKSGIILYFVNAQFNPQNPDEKRLPWDKAGKEFWEIEKG